MPEHLARASRTLAELYESDPTAAAMAEADGPLPDRAGYVDAISQAHAADGMPGLRRERRRRLLQIAWRDLAGDAPFEMVGRALADLADACLHVALEDLGAAAVVGVIGMGKLGGRELNYSSDVDLMFVADGDLEAASRAAPALLRSLGEVSPQGQAYRIDTNLRPEGRAGALVRSVDGYLEYYRRWAKPWEHQALIKARAAAGNRRLAAAVVEATRSIVFPTEVTPERIVSVRRMKERVEGHAQRTARRGRDKDVDDVKLGPGGIRDIEFSVQLLQLVHGGGDPSVRDPNTLGALGSLVDGGYVAEDDGAGLAVAYRWLRTVEHRLQLWQEHQVHHLPTQPEARSRIARVMGFKDSPGASALQRFESAHRSVLADVRGRFEKLFYRPMIESLADAAGPRLPAGALQERLRVLGFRDVERAARTLDGLVSGTSRRAKLFRVLTPALLRFLATSPLPDEGLFAFLRLGEALESRLDTLGALRDNPPGLAFLAKVLGSGRLLGEVLAHVPEELATIAAADTPVHDTGLEIKPRERLVTEAVASLRWRGEAGRLVGLRRFKRREMLRVALADLGEKTDDRAVGVALSDVADACLEAALADSSIPFAVIGMGKLGGRELNYSSDIDVMFVHEGDPAAAERLAEDLLRAVGEVTPEGQAFRIDAALRPEGKAGPLARSFDSFLEYYERWAKPWEHLALIKARVASGDQRLGKRLVDATRDLAFPAALRAEALTEIRHLKARMERERIPRGVEPRRHFKLGPGGLSDIEFAVQLTQLAHAHDRPALATGGTLDALGAARDEGVIDEPAAFVLDEAYRFLTRLRNRLFFMQARPTDALPTRPEDLEALGIAMGYTDQPRQELEEDYLRYTRRARKVAEPLIF